MIPQLQIGLCALESTANHDHGFDFDGRAATQQMEQLNAISSIPFTQTDTTIESHEEVKKKPEWIAREWEEQEINPYNETKMKKSDDRRWYHILVCRYSIQIRVWTGKKRIKRRRDTEKKSRVTEKVPQTATVYVLVFDEYVRVCLLLRMLFASICTRRRSFACACVRIGECICVNSSEKWHCWVLIKATDFNACMRLCVYVCASCVNDWNSLVAVTAAQHVEYQSYRSSRNACTLSLVEFIQFILWGKRNNSYVSVVVRNRYIFIVFYFIWIVHISVCSVLQTETNSKLCLRSIWIIPLLVFTKSENCRYLKFLKCSNWVVFICFNRHQSFHHRCSIALECWVNQTDFAYRKYILHIFNRQKKLNRQKPNVNRFQPSPIRWPCVFIDCWVTNDYIVFFVPLNKHKSYRMQLKYWQKKKHRQMCDSG